MKESGGGGADWGSSLQEKNLGLSKNILQPQVGFHNYHGILTILSLIPILLLFVWECLLELSCSFHYCVQGMYREDSSFFKFFSVLEAIIHHQEMLNIELDTTARCNVG